MSVLPGAETSGCLKTCKHLHDFFFFFHILSRSEVEGGEKATFSKTLIASLL